MNFFGNANLRKPCVPDLGALLSFLSSSLSGTINSTLSESECDSRLSLSPPRVKPVDTRAAIRVRTFVGVSPSRSARARSPFLSLFCALHFFSLSSARTRMHASVISAVLSRACTYVTTRQNRSSGSVNCLLFSSLRLSIIHASS